MVDTAQPLAAETNPNVQIENAADAFKAFTSSEPVAKQPPRDDYGRFTRPEDEEAAQPEQPEDYEGEEGEAEAEDAQEAADESAQPMPPSWPADKAEQWAQLPAETQSFLAAREAERERAVQTKFQEAALTRKSAELERIEAANSRAQYAQGIETVMTLLQVQEPDPRQYGAGTGQYDREAYDLAVIRYREQAGLIQGLQAQRQQIAAAAAQEEAQRLEAYVSEVNEKFAPQLMQAIATTDPVKLGEIEQSLVRYAVEHGIPEETFTDPSERKAITSAQMLLLWKAQQYDNLKTKAPAPKPKQAGPAVRPGVSSPRSAQKSAQRTREFDRLNREGSIEAGAAVFKHFM